MDEAKQVPENTNKLKYFLDKHSAISTAEVAEFVITLSVQQNIVYIIPFSCYEKK